MRKYYSVGTGEDMISDCGHHTDQDWLSWVYADKAHPRITHRLKYADAVKFAQDVIDGIDTYTDAREFLTTVPCPLCEELV